jgi:hypothetical protein
MGTWLEVGSMARPQARDKEALKADVEIPQMARADSSNLPAEWTAACLLGFSCGSAHSKDSCGSADCKRT